MQVRKETQARIDNFQKLLNTQDMEGVQSYLGKYFRKDESLMMDDMLYRLDFLPRKEVIYQLPDPQKVRMHNHFEFNWMIGNKKAMFYNMRQYYDLKGEDVFQYLPLTFHIQKGLEDKEYKNFLKFFKQREREIQKQDEQIEEGGKNSKKIKKLLGK